MSSDAQDASRLVTAFQLAVPAADGWQRARSIVAALPRTKIISESDDYLHAECRSAVFGFVDDLELHLRSDEGVIAVRSAARWGYSDLGVNRRRVETLRAQLVQRRVIR